MGEYDICHKAQHSIVANRVYERHSFVQSLVFEKIRQRTGRKMLWLRSLGSSFAANLVNSLIFCGIVFGGVVSSGELWGMVFTSCSLMLLCEVLLTPVNYFVVGQIRKTIK